MSEENQKERKGEIRHYDAKEWMSNQMSNQTAKFISREPRGVDISQKNTVHKPILENIFS